MNNLIHSMTAFARGQSQGEWGSFVCEMRSINHRYLEISLHMPEVLRALEMPVRERVRQFVSRGKIECNIRYQSNPSVESSSFLINMPLAKELCQASEVIAGYLKDSAPVHPAEILRFPGVLQAKEADIGAMELEVFQLVEKTLHDLVLARGREGEGLTKLFLDRLDLMQNELLKVRERLPQVKLEAQERLMKRFADAEIELDPGRLEQEMVMFAQKMDVSEELDRTETHLKEIRRILKHGGTAGRRLDFLAQELNREANTLGSKSTDSVITHAAVELKVLIEQIREQVQNVE